MNRCVQAALAGLGLLAACGGGQSDDAVLEELRQLRQAVAPAPLDARALSQALEPLHERLRALDRADADQRQRQAIADELAHWSMAMGRDGRLPAGGQLPEAAPLSSVPGRATRGDPANVPPVAQSPLPPPQQPAATAPDPALAARLGELEQRLHDSARRQDDLDAVVARALDGTTAHVDRILAQLQELAARSELAAAPVAPASGPTTAPSEPRADAESQPPAATARPTFADAEQREQSFLSARQGLRQPWLIAVLAAGLLFVGWIAWRLWPRAASTRPSQAREEPRGEMSADELWAAAGLLSEAVGRLRSAVPSGLYEAPAPAAGPAPAAPVAAPAAAAEVLPPAPPAEPADEPPAAAVAPAADAPDASPELDLRGALGSDDVFVLDDERSLLANVDWSRVGTPELPARSETDGGNTPAPAETNGHGELHEPPRWTMQLAAKDHVLARATVDAYLRHDPRVLRSPAPVVRSGGEGLEVQVALLPGLLAGEREHLRATLQRLLQA